MMNDDDFRIDSEVRCEGAHPVSHAFSRRGVNPIKLAYDPRRRPHSDQRL